MLTEYRNNNFDTDNFKSIKFFKSRFDYCKQTLGKPIGNGSSRIVWKLNDKLVIKLAKNKKGLAQNQAEINLLKNNLYKNMFTKIYEFDNVNYQWLITEKAQKLTNNLTQKILNIDYDTFEDFCISTWMSKPEFINQPYYKELPKHYKKMLVNNKPLQQWYRFIMKNNQIYSIAELINPSNLGVVIRNNQPQIIIIDAGFNEDIAKNQYNIAETVKKVINEYINLL